MFSSIAQNISLLIDLNSSGEEVYLLLGSLNDAIKKHLAYNICVYLIIAALFIFGTAIGALAVNNIGETTKADARIYLEGFLSIASKGGLNSAQILKQSVKFNLYFALAVFSSGLVYLGIIFIPALTVFRGFCIGFSIAFLAENYRSGGFLLSIGSVLPQNIIYVPIFIVMSVIALNYSLQIFKNKYIKKSRADPGLFTAYAFSNLILFILLIAGSIVEAYITSTIVKTIVPYIS